MKKGHLGWFRPSGKAPKHQVAPDFPQLRDKKDGEKRIRHLEQQEIVGWLAGPRCTERNESCFLSRIRREKTKQEILATKYKNIESREEDQTKFFRQGRGKRGTIGKGASLQDRSRKEKTSIPPVYMGLVGKRRIRTDRLIGRNGSFQERGLGEDPIKKTESS